MTQRIESQVPSSEMPAVPGVGPARPDAGDRVWRWGYIAICLLAIVAAIVIARGGGSNAELGFARVVIDAAPVFPEICTASIEGIQ
jgi:hypothetical protein